ncbi:MAG: hypothetical protein R2856_26300 [Caldilineaceae bacterium]
MIIRADRAGQTLLEARAKGQTSAAIKKLMGLRQDERRLIRNGQKSTSPSKRWWRAVRAVDRLAKRCRWTAWWWTDDPASTKA